MQVDDDLAFVDKSQRDHAAGALVVDIHVALVIEPVAGGLDGFKHAFGQVLVLKVRHYNPVMVFSVQILGRLRAAGVRHGLVMSMLALLLGTAVLSGCGQKGPLFLAVPPKAPPALQTDTLPSLTTAPPAVTLPALPASDAP